MSSYDLWFLLHLCLLLYRTAIAALPIIPINNITCHDTCGSIPVKFPFGTSFGCGHPDFARYISCSSSVSLQFLTGTGVYDISSIDYDSNTVILTDPLMSTCSSMQNSGSFLLDQDSPFTLTEDNMFVLLGCSRTSPVFDPYQDLCITGSGSRVCRGLYSCKAVTGIGLQQNAAPSTCCVYESPSGFSSGGYTLDVQKLQCSSYSALYGFGNDAGNPMKWNFGISLRYNDTHYTDSCKNCESSGGVCGFAGLDESFACLCQNGMNSTNNCLGRGIQIFKTIHFLCRLSFKFLPLLRNPFLVSRFCLEWNMETYKSNSNHCRRYTRIHLFWVQLSFQVHTIINSCSFSRRIKPRSFVTANMFLDNLFFPSPD